VRVKWWVGAVNFLFLLPLLSWIHFFGLLILECAEILRRERRGEWWVDAGEVSNLGSIMYSQSGSNDFVYRLGS
jgi:hypothetical protein